MNDEAYKRCMDRQAQFVAERSSFIAAVQRNEYRKERAVMDYRRLLASIDNTMDPIHVKERQERQKEEADRFLLDVMRCYEQEKRRLEAVKRECEARGALGFPDASY